MGHEFAGVVEESPDSSLVGRQVVGELNASCGKCIYCRTGRPTHCSSRRVLGMHRKDGCFGEYMTIDTSLLHVIPQGLSLEKAIYTEPLAAAFEIMTQVSLDDKNVAVLGDGRLAYCVVQAMRAVGKRVTVIGKHPEKLTKYAGLGQTRLAALPEETFELVVEASGSPLGLQMASDLVRRQGTIVLKSTYAGTAQGDMSRFVVNEITIKGSRCGPFEPALRLLDKGLVKLPEVEFYELEDWERAFASGAFKAGFAIGGNG